MKKTTFAFLLFFPMYFGFSQTNDDYTKIVTQISDAYNDKNADQIFNLFAPDLQASYPLVKVKELITGYHTEKGSVTGNSFLMDDEKCKRYLMDFDNASMLLIICLTSDNKLTQFKIEEY